MAVGSSLPCVFFEPGQRAAPSIGGGLAVIGTASVAVEPVTRGWVADHVVRGVGFGERRLESILVVMLDPAVQQAIVGEQRRASLTSDLDKSGHAEVLLPHPCPIERHGGAQMSMPRQV